MSEILNGMVRFVGAKWTRRLGSLHVFFSSFMFDFLGSTRSTAGAPGQKLEFSFYFTLILADLLTVYCLLDLNHLNWQYNFVYKFRYFRIMIAIQLPNKCKYGLVGHDK